MKLKYPYNSIHVNPQLIDLLIPDAVISNTQRNAMLGEFPEFTEDGIKIFVDGEYKLVEVV